MKTFFTVPRQALADLLQAAGSTLTPEQYVATLTVEDAYRKYPSRAWSAALSKYVLVFVDILGLVLTPFLGFTIENILVVVGLLVVTYFEYRVHWYFRTNDPRAPLLGYRNQVGFATGIVIYCLYHAFAPFQLSPDAQLMIEQNNLIDNGTLSTFVRAFYLFVALLAGGSQYGLACYYRSAQMKPAG